MDDSTTSVVDSSTNNDTYSLGSSGIDNFAVQELNEKCTNLNQVPLLKDALSELNMVLLACGDANGFLSDNISDAIASFEAFCVIAAKDPASFIIAISGSDKEFIARQIEALTQHISSN
jgi:hypothetical protein